MLQTKQCSKCETTKSVDEFSKNKNYKDGHQYWCKKCMKLNSIDKKEEISKYRKKYYKINKDYIVKQAKEYYKINRDEKKEYQKRYRIENKDLVVKREKKYKAKNKNKTNKRTSNRRKNDIQFKVSMSLRSRLYSALKGNYKSGSAVGDLGTSIESFMQYFIPKFYMRDDGKLMTWDNHGEWHIDHIIPLSKFDLTDREQLLKACHYTNLQPLWAEDNITKGNR